METLPLAQKALEDGKPVAILDDGIEFANVHVGYQACFGDENDPTAEKIVQDVWNSRGSGKTNGLLAGIVNIGFARGSLLADAVPSSYSEYLATDALIRASKVPLKLAVGAHCLITHGDDALVLVGQDGKLSIPGGAVDATDVSGGMVRIDKAVSREILEETGYQVSEEIRLLGVFAGGRPIHLLFLCHMALPETCLSAIIGSSDRSKIDEGIIGVRLVPMESLRSQAERTCLATRLALPLFPGI